MVHKKDIVNAITSLPEDVEIEDVMYRLYVLDKISQGQDAIAQGKKITLPELKKEVQNW